MTDTDKKKIIIVGAGLAGLAACTKLLECGFDPLILEARNRCGGRVWVDNSLGIPIGLGANWIHGDKGNPITGLAKEYQIKMSPKKHRLTIIYDKGGKEIPYAQVQKFDYKFYHLLKKTEDIAFSFDQDVSLSSILSACVQLEKFSSINLDLYKNKLYFFENYLGADYDLLSARYWNQEATWPGANCLLTNSYNDILNGLKKKCRVLLKTCVKGINLRKKDIELITDQSNFYADVVITTLPLGVLKNNSVIFNPPLPMNKQNSISRLGMGLLNLAVLEFPTVFWPKRAQTLFFSEFDELSISSFTNLYHFIKKPILLGYYGGKRAQELENASDNAIIERTMKNFRNHFGTSIPNPKAFINTRWFKDPFSYGSYSYLKVGSCTNDYDVISEPIENRLFFAGEASCSKYFATTHGAYLSGIREAERIDKLLKSITKGYFKAQ